MSSQGDAALVRLACAGTGRDFMSDAPHRWRAPYRIETARLVQCALGPEHVEPMHDTERRLDSREVQRWSRWRFARGNGFSSQRCQKIHPPSVTRTAKVVAF